MSTEQYELCEQEVSARELSNGRLGDEILDLNDCLLATKRSLPVFRWGAKELVRDFMRLDQPLRVKETELGKQPENESPHQDEPEDLLAAAKLFEPLSSGIADSIGSQVSRRDPQAVHDLHLDVQRLQKEQEACMAQQKEWQAAGILPVFDNKTLRRHAIGLPDEYCLAVLR